MNVRKDIPLGFLPAFSLRDYPVGSLAIVRSERWSPDEPTEQGS